MTGTAASSRRVYEPIQPDAIDSDVVKVVRRLRRFHHEAYLVGGCVRDLLLDERPKDFDVATSAKPREVRKLFRNSRVIGRRFQLVHVLFRDRKVIEVATFRQPPVESGDDDLLITDDNVFGTASDDAFRRDFTINALFYDLHSREIVDFVDGLADIQGRMVRCIGDPDVRLREDPVRMLRAIKFAARLALDIEPGLWDAIQRHREDIARAAVPRLLEEIYRIFRPGRALAAFHLLRDAGLLELLVPEVAHALVPAGDAQGDPDPVATCKALLRGYDAARSLRPEPFDDAVVLAVLHWQAFETAVREAETRADGRVDMGALVKDFLSPTLTELRVPRRTQDRFRQVLVAQRRFDPGRRRRKSEAFVRRSYFQQAVELFEIRLRAKGLSLDPVHAWRDQAGLPALDPAREEPPEPSESRPKRRRRRRRRRGRGRGRGRGPGGASEG